MTSTNLDDASKDTDHLPNIALPVFLRVSVDNYELFPGREGDGLHHTFVPGVTVIAGINGLGKTTLLNIMLRLLLGPFNPEKAVPTEVGVKSHELIRWRDARKFFASRVLDRANDAIAKAEFSIDGHVFVIERYLKDLSIKFLEYDTQELEPTEEEYERVILAASKVSSRYDFDFLVRYLAFFLEQRVPLFWNERGQIETFRILLCDSILADEFQSKQDEIQSKDSQFRSFRWQINKQETEYLRRVNDTQKSSALTAKVTALQESYRAQTDRNRELVRAIESTSAERSELRNNLLLTKIELEEVRNGYEALQQSYLAKLFPQVEESARYVFATLLSKGGCAVCGNQSTHGFDRLQHLLSHGICPACESKPEEQEKQIDADIPAPEKLKSAGDTLLRLQRAVSVGEEKERDAFIRLKQLATEQRQIHQDMAKTSIELSKLKSRLPATADEVKGLQQQVQYNKDVLTDMRAELERLYIEYEEMIQKVKIRVEKVSEEVRRLFSTYAQSFMAENVTLGLSSYKDNVGQEKKFEYPCFSVFMTSAVSPDRETLRVDENDVSESQREFIDLAFRMALITAVASKNGRAMLVIETPEASLDAYFVNQAGELLRQFGKANDPNGNVVIVSSNLARQNMIPALLGFTALREQDWPNSDTVKKHLINMLDECTPNAALRERREIYETALHEATRNRLITRVN